MTHELPPIVKLAGSVLASIEDAATRFPRKHRYTFGSDLRQCAMKAALLAQEAWRYRSRRREKIRELILAIDELKLRLQLGDSIQAFSSHRSFEHIARLVSGFGRQAGGWYKEHLKGQSAAPVSAPQGAPTLSAQATPAGVNP